MGYSAYVLTEESRATLLKRFPPYFPESIAHHVTYQFPDQAPPPPLEKIRVVGYALSESLECVVVEVDGQIHRPTDGLFHITLSLDRAQGAKPVHSNRLIKKAWNAIEPFYLEVKAELLN